MFEHLEESLMTDCDCYGCRNERVGIGKAFRAIREMVGGAAPEEEVQTLGDIADNLIRAIGLCPDEVYEQFVHLLLSRRSYGGWVAECGKWAIQSNRAGLVLDVTVDKDSVLILEDKDGPCHVVLEFKAGKHITVFEDEERGGWTIGARGSYCGRDIRATLGVPYIGQRVILNCLLKGGSHPGTIVQIRPIEKTYRGHPLCTVKLDGQKALVYNTVYYTEEPGEVRGTLWQICYPFDRPRSDCGRERSTD